MSDRDPTPPVATVGIASLRVQAVDGRVMLPRAPATVVGRLLGAALLADTLPLEARVEGRRHVTALMALGWHPEAPNDPPLLGRVAATAGPAIVSTGVEIHGRSSLLVVARTVFAVVAQPPLTTDPAARSRAGWTSIDDLDRAARTIRDQLELGRRPVTAGWHAALEVAPLLRNRRGSMHGAAVYGCLASVALGRVGLRQPRRIIDSRVRYFRPIVDPVVNVGVTSMSSSRRLVDMTVGLTSSDGIPLAIGDFLILRDRRR